jgi:hypothetical protein
VVFITAARLQTERPGFEISQGRIFLSVVEPTQPPVQCVPGLKRPGREADHSLPCSVRGVVLD